MNIPNDIQLLLDRYLDGLTSLEEEDRLADYFRSHDVPEAWQAYKEMFAYFDAGMPTDKAEEKSVRNTIAPLHYGPVFQWPQPQH